ncbi:hypothetical protein D3C83_15250 [compost metagenome]
MKPEFAPAENKGSKNVSGSPGVCAIASIPPVALSRIGIAIAKPVNLTISWTALTPTELNSPPALKYPVIAAPPIRTPAQFGRPATTANTAAPSSSWPARMNSAPNQIRDVTITRTLCPYRSCRKSPTVR